MSLIKQLVAANATRIVTAMVEGAAVQFAVQGVNEGRTGKLKNGTEDNYVLLVNTADNTVTIDLNPRKAEQLFNKGTVDNLTLEAVADIATAPAAGSTETTDAPAKETKPKKEKVAKEPKAPKDPALNKSFHFLAAYKAAVDAAAADATGETKVVRKDVIADARARVAAAGLGELSDAAVNTYYQNCKSGKWA